MCMNETNRMNKQKDHVSGNNTTIRLILPQTTFPRIELPDLLPQGLLMLAIIKADFIGKSPLDEEHT